MKTTCTPGPWRIRSLQSEGHDIGFTDDLQIATVPDSDGFGVPVAMVCYNGKNRREANAALIAAAPDLLAALEDLRAELRQHIKMDVKKHYSLMVADVAADKAIAKARGQQ